MRYELFLFLPIAAVPAWAGGIQTLEAVESAS